MSYTLVNSKESLSLSVSFVCSVVNYTAKSRGVPTAMRSAGIRVSDKLTKAWTAIGASDIEEVGDDDCFPNC